MANVLNVLTRPKRSIHNKKLVITEELAQLIGKDYNSESDEEFLPEKSLKKCNDDSNKNTSSDSHDSSGSSSIEKSSDDEDTDDRKNSDFSDKEDDKKKVKKEKKNVKSKKNPNNNEDKKKKKPINKKKIRENNKRKKLHQLKVNELKDENNKILEKLSSRIKSASSKTPTAANSSGYNGPVARQEQTIINNKSYPIYIISSSRAATVDAENEENGSKKVDVSLIKIPKEKIPPITDPSGIWLCKLCQNRPNYKNLGDLYGPYFINSEVEDAPDEVWMHENCIVWTPNVYIKNNKLFGLSDADKTALDKVK